MIITTKGPDQKISLENRLKIDSELEIIRNMEIIYENGNKSSEQKADERYVRVYFALSPAPQFNYKVRDFRQGALLGKKRFTSRDLAVKPSN